MVISSVTSSYLRPMKRLTENTVFSGLVTCCRRAGAPTSRCPSFVNATTDGVVRPPSAFAITVGSPPSRTAMHEFVVPRSMPIVFAIELVLLQVDVLRKSKPQSSRSRLSLCAIVLADGDRDAEGAGGDPRRPPRARPGARCAPGRRLPRPDR